MARSILWFLQTAATRPDSPTDAELLRRFAASREEAAFELLVRRHAPAVWATCRNVLRNNADAEDAFQAAFLALARSAGSVRAGVSLGGWLHRVATNAALKLRAKRPKSEPLSADVPAPSVKHHDTDEVSAVHEELAGLSNAYRTTLVLVDLEGHTHTDAAKILGWPVGTVSGRLVRARAELKRRLERRGFTGAAVLTGGIVSGSTIRAAVNAAVGTTPTSAVVNSLTNEVVTMLVNAKRKLVAMTAAGLIGLTGLGAGGVAVLAQPMKPEPAKTDPAKADKPADGWNEKGKYPSVIPEVAPAEKFDFDAEIKKLPEIVVTENDEPVMKAAKGMLRARLEEIRILRQRTTFSINTAEYHSLVAALTGVTDAADTIWLKPGQLELWYQFRLVVLKDVEQFIHQRVIAGVNMPHLQPLLVAERYAAEIALLKLREKAKK